jgi:nickel transport protein
MLKNAVFSRAHAAYRGAAALRAVAVSRPFCIDKLVGRDTVMPSLPCRSVAALLVAAGLLLVSKSAAWSHGLSWRPLNSVDVLAFEARYSTGAPVSFADVLIHCPQEGGVELQNGRTDRHGRFAFIPDKDGDWRVELDAGMGHRLEFAMRSGPQDETPNKVQPKPSVLVLALLGVSLLLNVFFLLGRLRRTGA